jgi:DNA-binding MarR family transcriptional regulator
MRENSARKRNHNGEAQAREAAVASLLECFYPVHYQIGTSLEDVFREGALTRKQFAILWLIHSEGEDGQRIQRKKVEAHLRRWFEVSSPAISQALGDLARPPLNMVELSIDPASGRERVVTLTPKGQRYLDTTSARAQRFLSEIVAEAPIELLNQAAKYFEIMYRGFLRVSSTDQASRRAAVSGGLGRRGGKSVDTHVERDKE